MAHYFFDAASEKASITDLHGQVIEDKFEVRPAMRDAVRAIRLFLGEDHSADEWNLEVRLGETNRIAAIRFTDIDGPQ